MYLHRYTGERCINKANQLIKSEIVLYTNNPAALKGNTPLKTDPYAFDKIARVNRLRNSLFLWRVKDKESLCNAALERYQAAFSNFTLNAYVNPLGWIADFLYSDSDGLYQFFVYSAKQDEVYFMDRTTLFTYKETPDFCYKKIREEVLPIMQELYEVTL